jgi:hypothetical protein
LEIIFLFLIELGQKKSHRYYCADKCGEPMLMPVDETQERDVKIALKNFGDRGNLSARLACSLILLRSRGACEGEKAPYNYWH